MDQEQWADIDEFPGYAVSSFGRVMHIRSRQIKKPTPNQQGIPSVIFYKDKTRYRRSVSILVATYFLPRPERISFDTPINLDGDRFNNHVDNLEWRPRWFAQKYHSQFKRNDAAGFDAAIELIQTGEIFEDVRDCASKYGLLEAEIVVAANNRIPVFPTWQEFQIV